MRKIIKMITISLFTCFSFYYTDKIVELSQKADPIMEQIELYKNKEEILPVNGILAPDSILVGRSGKKVDVNTSYEKMKKLNEYNEKLFEYIEVKPSILKKDNLDKYILGANTTDKKISIIFEFQKNSISNIQEVVDILNKNNISSNFFIDAKEIESNLLALKQVLNNRISLGIYGYDKLYNASSIIYTKNIIMKNFELSNYCLYKDDKFLNTCASYRINTIKPINIRNNLYNYLTLHKSEGYIYKIEINQSNIKQLNSTIIYLKQKGYDILNLEELLKE